VKRIKTLLILVLVVAFVVLVSGCGMLGSRSAGVDSGSSSIDELPQWLTLAHRAEAAEEPEVVEEEEAAEEETVAVPAQTGSTQPATNQPAATQPAQTEQPVQSSGTPKYLQPGTMEYLAKLQLDQTARDLKKLDSEIASETNKEKANNLKALRNSIVKSMATIAEGIGLDLKKEYGISPATAGINASGEATWFHNWNESPSGFGD